MFPSEKVIGHVYHVEKGNKKQVYSYIIFGNALFQLFLNSIRQALHFIYTTLMNNYCWT